MASFLNLQTLTLLFAAFLAVIAIANAEPGMGRKLLEDVVTFVTSDDGYITASNGDIAITSVRSSGD